MFWRSGYKIPATIRHYASMSSSIIFVLTRSGFYFICCLVGVEGMIITILRPFTRLVMVYCLSVTVISLLDVRALFRERNIKITSIFFQNLDNG